MVRLISSTILVAFTLLSTSSIDGRPQPPVDILPKNPTAPLRLEEARSKSVLIVGGGLAGLSAALELSERGYNVTVREANAVVGGRVMGYKTTVDYPQAPLTPETEFNVEHGFHAFFHNYHNLKNVRDRLGINQFFRQWNKVEYIFRDYKPESIGSEGPYPLNLLKILADSPNLGLTNAIKSTLMLPDILFFNYDNVYHDWDNMTIAEWAKKKLVDKAFYDIIIQPAGSVTLNEPETISAATMLMFMQLYFLSDAKADQREVLTEPFNIGLLNPWVKRIEENGGRVLTDSPVPGLVFENGSAVRPTDEPSARYDSVILSTDIPGLRSVLKASSVDVYSKKACDSLKERANRVGVAPPYKVLRVWFQGKLNANRPDILETPQHRPINLVAQYSLIENEYIEWANKNNGTVIEFHLYTWKDEWKNVYDAAEVWKLVSPTAQEIYSEISQMKPIGFTLQQFENFPSYAKGQEHFRPDTKFPVSAGLKNVYLAGDWIHTSYPSALMERAVSTGREAANHILLADNVRQATMRVNTKYGPGPI